MKHLSIHIGFSNYYTSLLRDLCISAREVKVHIMRKVAVLVIFAYVLMLLKPMMPVMTDAMAHTFWKSKHMLIVHEVHGKFHVHQEVVNAAKQAEGEHSKSVKVQEEESLFVLPVISISKASFVPNLVSVYSVFICADLSSFGSTFYPPPRI